MSHATVVPQFREATRMQAKASIMIEGLSGKGKSGLALMLAYGLSKDWGKVFAVDTENRSLDLFEGLTAHIGIPYGKFRKLDLLSSNGYSPSNYLACMEAAIKNGADVVILDSISHMWQQKGGVLDMVSEVKSKDSKLNNWTAWGVPVIVAEKNMIYDTIRDSAAHVITTVRVKEKFELVDGKMLSLGEQQLVMPDLKYEPDLVLSMVSPGTPSGKCPVARVIKSRYAIFSEGETYTFTEELIEQLRAYLDEGADPAAMIEAQRQSYISEIQSILDNNASARTMWPILKETAGHKDTQLPDMDMKTLRQLFGQLVN